MTPLIIFPPAASATYIPLGVSYLKAYMDKQKGPGSLRVVDLNIRLWNHVADREEAFEDYRSFVKGEKGFFSKSYLQSYLAVRQNLKKKINDYLDRVALYLNKGELGFDLEKLFVFLTAYISSDSLFLGFSCLFPDQLLFALGFTRWLRETGYQRQIYIGGASVMLCPPEDLLESALWLDGLIMGEGELSMAALVDGLPPQEIPGFVWRNKGRIIRNRKPDSLSLKSIALPDFSWADFRDYFNPEPVLPVLLSRGCKWRKCRFCAHNFSFSGYRSIQPSLVADWFQQNFEKQGIRFYYFADQYLDSQVLEPLADELISRNLPVFYTFMGRPAADMTRELLDKLYRSGCRWISWGVESGSKDILDTAEKGTFPEIISGVLKNSREAGIKNLAMMIFGLPGSNDKALQETFNFLEENSSYIDTLTSSEFLLYQDTPFGKNPGKFALVPEGPIEFCRIGEKSISTVQTSYKIMENGYLRMPRGPEESDQWLKRKPWIYPPSIFDHIPSEHYLIISAIAREPDVPVRPFPLKEII
ncbi:MAG: B12-binding domain-containing radical SAM protein [Spirochaetales bacterium]|nr:B12-binding domain-containing radical SAM protein [Spirochaetales bacterium]